MERLAYYVVHHRRIVIGAWIGWRGNLATVTRVDIE